MRISALDLLDTEVHLSVVAWAFMVVSALVSSWTGWWALDSVGALASLGLLVPIMQDLTDRTAPILLQTSPAGPRAAFDKASREVRCVRLFSWAAGFTFLSFGQKDITVFVL